LGAHAYSEFQDIVAKLSLAMKLGSQVQLGNQSRILVGVARYVFTLAAFRAVK
jgi:hypothetical protein